MQREEDEDDDESEIVECIREIFFVFILELKAGVAHLGLPLDLRFNS